ncbi:PTS system cellobiose-specific IIA component [Breznakia blatticola]|uniref:PTS system cellobiose-specific IIA component n=1 Tax=Breznakia blatticola TaxID=1754012 RepID=A0A4R7ZJF6_9FIRM|nr:PTS lactose/cellobiose transporter subunit IIA [Breznakia blatticola]TDW16528.1 PTS system cellobiose-specific IIA component [Breznakia blatticola]
MEGMELISFQIISSVGTARSMYIEAIQAAKNKDFAKAKELISEGEKISIEGHHAHAALVQKEADGEKIQTTLLLIHAEDQLMSAEGFKIIAEELVELYKMQTV